MGEQPASTYDNLNRRLFEFILIWVFAVFYLYHPLSQSWCCGVKVEQVVPWEKFKQGLTTAYMSYAEIVWKYQNKIQN